MKRSYTDKKLYVSLLAFTLINTSFTTDSIASSYTVISARYRVSSSKRLLATYYQLKDSDPQLAKQTLKALLMRDPNNVTAHLEMGYLLDEENQKSEALSQFMTASRLAPNDDRIKLQIGYALDGLGRSLEAKKWFIEAYTAHDPAIKRKAQAALNHLDTVTNESAIDKSSGAEKALNEFYQLKDKNRALAKQKLEQILNRYPTSAVAHLEMGYLLDEDNQKKEALAQFRIAAQLNPADDQTKLQIGYELDELGHAQKAKTWFTAAAASTDLTIRRKAQLALTDLANASNIEKPGQTFTEIYTEPYYSSRFSEGVLPIQARIGRSIDEKTKIYFSIRATRDTKSKGGVNPQIYDDNAFIAGVGMLRQLRPNFSAYAEAGVGYDLVDMNRPRARPDLRGGLIYYREWLRDAHPGQNTGDLYGDVSYYSRYHNLIGDLRVRDGVNVFQHGSSRVNVYLKGELFADTGRLYYNNRLEVGPGVSYIPNINSELSIRLEALKGKYTGNFSDNPYPSNYFDTRLSVEYDINF